MSKPLNVLHIIDSLGLGGAQILVKGFFEAQQDNRLIHLFSLRERTITIQVDHPHVERYSSTRKFSLKPLLALRSYILRNKIEVLHCHLFRSQVFGFLLKKLWFKDVKLVFHEHGRALRKGFVNRIFLRLAKRLVDKFIAVSRATAQVLMDLAGIAPSQITVISNFYDQNRFKPSTIGESDRINARTEFGISRESFVIGFVGRLNEVKGCEYLLRAMSQLDQGVQLLIAGDGPLIEYLKQVVKDLAVEDRVTFLGFLEDTTPLYSILDLLVVPSRSESFGLSVIEGQAMGVPVIASRVGGLSEVVEDGVTGLLFAPENADDLVEKIRCLMQDDALRARIQNAAFESVKRYTLRNHLDQTNKLYQSL